MPSITEATIITVLQTALTPAFLLVALGSLLALFAGRMIRIVDRSRDLQERFNNTKETEKSRVISELRETQKRIKIVNSALFLAVFSAFVVCILIGLLFFMGLTGTDMGTLIAIAFIVALALMAASLVQFLREVTIAVKTVAVPEKYLDVGE